MVTLLVKRIKNNKLFLIFPLFKTSCKKRGGVQLKAYNLKNRNRVVDTDTSP